MASIAPPTVSVIIPTRNRARTLGPVLEETAAQAEEAGGEVVVVDDGSSDGTPDLLHRIAQRGLPVRFTRIGPRGPAAARNRGIEMARGSVLLFLGDDTYPSAGLVEGHVRAHRGGERITVVGKVDWDTAMQPSPLMRMMAPNGPLFNFRKAANCAEGRHRFFYTANLSIAAPTLGDARFDERFEEPAFEDVELGVRLQRRGVTLVYRPDLVVFHRHVLRARDLARRLAVLRRGRKTLEALHPELRAGPRARARDWLLAAWVITWVPLEYLPWIGPRAPREWTGGD